jgi:soluble lytic murein transglycosylase-like protein
MKRLTVAAAAFAAGVLTFAVQSHAESSRSSHSTSVATSKASKPAKEGKGKQAKAVTKEKGHAKGKAHHKSRRSAAPTKSGKKEHAKTKAAVAKVDKLSTASTASSRPELKVVARKAVEGLRDGAEVGKIAGAVAYTTLVSQYATSYGVPESLAHAVVSVESNFEPGKRGSAGEIGLMQIKPATARLMGYSGSESGLFDPETNIKYGMKYLAKARDLAGGDMCGTILRYNAGHSAKQMNPVSAAYCVKVKALVEG